MISSPEKIGDSRGEAEGGGVRGTFYKVSTKDDQYSAFTSCMVWYKWLGGARVCDEAQWIAAASSPIRYC